MFNVITFKKEAPVVAVVSVLASVQQVREQKKATRARRRMVELRNIREKRKSVREAARARAQIEAETEERGAATTSAAQGAQASVQSQLGANLSFLDTSAGLEREALGAQSGASTAEAVSSITGQLAQSERFASIFEENQ